MSVSDNVQIVQTVINGCVGVMTIIVGVIAIIIYRGQLDEMRKTTEAANQSAEVAKKTLDSSSQTFSDTLKEMQKQSDAMTLQATATQNAVAISKANLEQARTAFLASVEHAHLDQRAWVGAYQINVDGSLSEDAKTYSLRGVNVVLRNGGKTPAVNVLVNLQIATSLNINNPDIPDPFRNHLMSANTIPPGGEYVQYNTMSVLLKGDDPQNKGTLFISGEIRYNDIFDGTPQHVTKYCVERVSGNNFTFCGENNSMN